MKRFVIATALLGIAAMTATAQSASTRANASANSEVSAQKQGRQIDLQSGTRIAAQLESALDARNAKVGDRVVLKTTQAVKQNGQVVIQKGSRLIGHITDVQQNTKSSGESHIALLFDRLRAGGTEIPINATIVSITQARSRTQTGNGGMESDTMAQSSTSARTSTSSSGLLGGVGNTVGGAVNTTTNTVAGTTNAVGSTVGTTTTTAGNLTGSLSGLQITQSTNASAQGGSTLSLTGRNLRLESGTTFHLSVNSSTSAGSNP